MKVTRVLHVSINTHGTFDAARRFYSDLFSLADKPRPQIPGIDGHWFNLGEAELHLVDAQPGSATIQPTGNHYCVAVDDLEAAIVELAASGVEYVRGAQGDVVQIWLADPAGNTIELQQDRG